MVVLQEEDLGCLEALRKNHCFIGVTLACCAIAEVDNDRFVLLEIPCRARTIKTNAHGVTGGVKRVRPNHQGVEVEVVGLLRIPTSVREASEHPKNVD